MIRTDGLWFKDEHGRTLMLRGVNLSGSTKVPYTPNGATHIRDRFFDYRNVSFVGRPFPLEQADEHFARLRGWGLTFLRFLVTWEAIEHAGPGIYDQAYLDYVRAVVEKAGEYGISLFIDPHQDVWSRFSGGDGAPGWTFEAVGLDVTKFDETGAAICHQIHGDPLPHLVWPTNATKLAAATMFTLFFGGNNFAPQTRVEGEPVQEFLQRHYLNAIKQLAARLADLPNVVGYDTMNEPLAGFIGCKDLHTWRGLAEVEMGASPSPWQGILLGAGYPQQVAMWARGWRGLQRVGQRWLNANQIRVWRAGFDCVWRQNGVWDIAADGSPQLLRPDYFCAADNPHTSSYGVVDFSQDYYRPFANRYAREIRSVDPDALIFVQTEFGGAPPRWGKEDAPNIVYAPHWYDGFVLFMKRYNSFIAVELPSQRIVIGPGRIRRSFAEQLARYKREAAERLGGAPVLLGEFGIPFDLRDARAFRTGDFGEQVNALDRSFRAVEDNLLNATLWTYTPDNTNARGDQWNGEDFSIYSPDQRTDPTDLNSGGRALAAVVRPYPRAIAGEPLHLSFDLKRGLFEFAFRRDPSVSAPTEIFVPDFQYPHGYRVAVSDGTYEKSQPQTLIYRHSAAREVHTIRIERK